MSDCNAPLYYEHWEPQAVQAHLIGASLNDIREVIREELQQSTQTKLAQQILDMIKSEREKASKLSETFAGDVIDGLVDDIEQLCQEQAGGKE